MPEPQNEQREPARQAQQSVYGQTSHGQPGQTQPGQTQTGQTQTGWPGQQGGQSADELKRQVRNAEAEAERMREAGREMAERFADRSREQIDRYERAYGDFWKVAESDSLVPFARNLARTNMEWAGLASRRAKAYVEFPAQVTQCNSPNEMLNRQMRFVGDMVRDYQETLGRVTRAWTEAAGAVQEEMQGFMQDREREQRRPGSGQQR
jgi:hypothetical protein